MRKLCLFFILAFMFAASRASAATYYISPTGSDSNNGLSSGAPWLSPNHALNCGDTISAASGTYSAGNFTNGHWGTVTCPSANNVAWLICATFDTCKISTNTFEGMWVDQSFWGVVGWEATTNTTTYQACFLAAPSAGTYTVHHVIFADNVANGCMGGGFISYPYNGSSATAGADYLAFIGNIAYNAVQGNTACYSGISIFEPIASDSNAGTHMYVAGNFSYGNVDPATCAGNPSTDGEAVILDTFDATYNSGTPYTQQAVVQNNLGFFNGGRGFEAVNNQRGSTHAPLYFKSNTSFGDMTDNNQTGGCFVRGELGEQTISNVTYDHNLAQTRTGTSCSSAPLYAFSILFGDATDTATNNWLYSAAGNYSVITSSGGFALGTGNVAGTSPAFANPVNPGAPSCGSFSSVAACMAAVVADYTPTVSGASSFGYQPPSNTSVTNALFPSWLCSATGVMNPNIPQGLITPGCGMAPVGGCALAAGASISQIQTAIGLAAANSCAAPNSSTVNFAAGSYTISSQLSIPCPVAPMFLQGPTPAGVGTTWPITPTAILSSTLGNNWAFSGTACSHGTTFQYLQYNGNLPPGGGGGFLSVPPGMNNLSVIWNWFYGNNATQQTTDVTDTFIYFNGSLSGSANQNVTIQWNRVGKLGGTECGGNGSDGNPAGSNGGLMDLYGSSSPPSVNTCSASGYAPPSGTSPCLYQGAQDITHGGGSCGFVGVNNNFATLLIANNSVTDQEEPVKFYECPGTTCNWSSSGLIVRANDFQGTHRIGAETQFNNVSSGANFLYDSNDFANAIKPNAGMWGLSLPQGTTDSRNNLLIANTALSNDKNGKPGQYFGACLEFWGTGTSSNNFCQGIWGSGVNFGFGGSPWSVNNNIFQMSASSLYITQEETSCCPAQSGNVTSSTVTTRPSVAPTISPSPGAQAYPLTVTLTDPGYTSGAGPQGNTGIWYTIDGTTPAPGSGSAKYLSTGQTFILSGPATVQAVGMWGALNQPASYPSGYGFVPSAVISAAFTSGGAVTLTGATISATGGVATLTVGQAVQMIVICHYSDGSTSGCNTTDSHGNSVTSWSSSNGNVTVNGSGLATGAVVGTATITAVVTGGTTTSPGAVLTVSAGPLTLSSISVATTGGVSSITVPATNQLLATGHYNDGSTTSLNATDSHGNAITTATSSAPTIATVTSPGALVSSVAAGSTNLTVSVSPAPSMLGTSLENVTGATGFGFINEIYGVTGTSAAGYTPGDCHIIIPATTNWTAGKLWTCLVVLGTPTTQSASALCSNSFTLTGTSWPGGDIVIPMASVCPTLPPDTGYWVGSTTSQTTASPTQGFSNCGSTCNGGPPAFGSGTYPYCYVANAFGNYTSLPTTFAGCSTNQQVSQYVLLTTTPVTSNSLPLTVNAAAPTLVSAYITGASSLVVPNTAQMAAKCHYTSGPDQDCTVADIYGDAVSAWLTSDATKATVQNVGGASPGLVTAVAAGTPSITAVINNTINSTAFPITVTNPAVTLTGISLSTTGGVTGLFVGSTNQLKATCGYSDGSHDDCTTTDAHGTLAHSWTSTTPAHATVNGTTGLTTGVAPGATTYTAVAGTFTSAALPLTILAVPSGTYIINLSGPVAFSGMVHF